MNFKRYNESDNSWTDSHYIMGTDTDTLTTLPAVIYPNASSITVGIKGNTTQSGTPSPQSPVDVNGTGDMSSNLLATLTVNYAIDASGNINSNSEFMYYTAPCEANETYTFSLDRGLSGNYVRIHAFNGDTWIEQLVGKEIVSAPFTVSTPVNTTNLKISITKGAKTYHTMLNAGSTPQPYEPYGFKIPISSANTTTPIYLGEVPTTRKIRKLVLDGTESYSLQSINSYGIANFYIRIGASNQNAICTHLSRQTTIISQTTDEGYLLTMPYQSGQLATFYMRISSSTASTVAELKEWLAAQYAAGTPVTVWYMLATPETAVVNEPLRKIGEYADEVSGITIPTIAGANTLSVDTTLQPSEVSVNYHGWHPVQSVHEAENGQWN